MKNSLLVHVFYPFTYLFNNCFSLFLSESFLFFKDSEKVPVDSIFQHHVEVGFVIEETIETHNIGMVQEELDL